MLQVEGTTAAVSGAFRPPQSRRCQPSGERWLARDAPAAALERALDLLDQGLARDADSLLTEALIAHPGLSDLWLAAGIARLGRGRVRSAAAALTMCIWIADEPLARELLGEIDGQ